MTRKDKYISEAELDDILSSAFSDDKALDVSSDAFIQELQAVPDRHLRLKPAKFGFSIGFLDDVLAFFSPKGLVLQGAVYALVLMAGIAIGAGDQADEMDLSTSLFAEADLYMDGQE